MIDMQSLKQDKVLQIWHKYKTTANVSIDMYISLRGYGQKKQVEITQRSSDTERETDRERQSERTIRKLRAPCYCNAERMAAVT